MRIAVASDIHLEFGPIELKNTENADVLILSGDICVAADLNPYGEDDEERSVRIHTFFQGWCSEFKHVMYVVGNHEHYHGDFTKTISKLKECLGYLVNLHILDKECATVNDVLFVGGTLWTNMNKEDGITLMHMKSMMNDFRIIKNSTRATEFHDTVGNLHFNTPRFTPEDSVDDHKEMLEYLKLMVSGKPDRKVVVVGHHAPSKLSTHPRYKDEDIMNGAYSSDLSEYILDHPQIKLWTHGHTHEDFDYLIGSTRIVCNPRGYIKYESRADEFNLKFVEI